MYSHNYLEVSKHFADNSCSIANFTDALANSSHDHSKIVNWALK